MDLLPIRPVALFSHIQTPYLEGCARLNLAWQGVDFALEPNPLSLEDRAVYWLQGTMLMIPILNTLLWLAWRTFGDPMRWTDAFCEESSIPPRIVQLPPPTPNTSHYLNAEGQFSTWKVTSSEHFDIVTEKTDDFSSAARYEEGELKEWSGLHKGQLTRICHTPNGLQIQTDPPVHLRYSEAPWIQQPSMGLKSWILSEEKTLEFDTVLFDPLPSLLTMQAIKHETIQTPEGRRLTRVEIVPQGRWLLQVLETSQWWFDADTAQVYQFNNAALFMHPGSGRVRHIDPLPGLRRP